VSGNEPAHHKPTTSPQDKGRILPDSVTEVTEAGAWDFLAGRELGRLAVCAAGIRDFYSVASVVDQHSIVFLAAPGKNFSNLRSTTRWSSKQISTTNCFRKVWRSTVAPHAWRPWQRVLPPGSPLHLAHSHHKKARCTLCPPASRGKCSVAHAKRYQGVTAHLLLRNLSLGTIGRSYSSPRSAGGHAPPLGGEVINPLVRGLRSAVAEQLPRWRE
jgi:hypothetical protein